MPVVDSPALALELAERQLREEANLCQHTELYFLRDMFEQLAHVADYARRCSLESASDHYRAGKAGDLAAWAIRAAGSALANFADRAGEADPDDATGAVDEIHELAGDTFRVLQAQAWRHARAYGVYRSDVDELAKVVARLDRVRRDLDLIARPDPVDP